MTYLHPDDRPSEFDGLLWDADPGVCCAAFQLGACAHTEAPSEDDEVLEPTWGEALAAWDPDVDGQGWAGLNAAADRIRDAAAEEPF